MKRYVSIILLLVAQQLDAQSILRMQHLSVEDGLSQNSVNYILQDTHGFMWFATGDGLDRYDGKDIIVNKMGLNGTPALQTNDRNINSSIFEDRHNRFWMTTDAGLSFMNTRNGKFEVVISNDVNKNAFNIMSFDGESIWVAVRRTGVVEVNTTTLQRREYSFTDSLQLRSAKVYPLYNGVATAKGLWIADNAGLLFFDKHTHKDERMFVSNDITGVYLLSDGRLLLTATGGIYLYDIEKRSPAFIPIHNETTKKTVVWESFAEDTAAHMVYLGSSNDGSIGKFDLSSHTYELIKFQNMLNLS